MACCTLHNIAKHLKDRDFEAEGEDPFYDGNGQFQEEEDIVQGVEAVRRAGQRKRYELAVVINTFY